MALAKDVQGTLDPVTRYAAEQLSGARRGLPLRTKGAIALAVVLLYIMLAGFLIAKQHAALRSAVDEQAELHATEEALARVNAALAYAILSVHEGYAAPDSRANAETIALHVEAVQAGMQALGSRYALVQTWMPKLERNLALLKFAGGRGSLVEIRESLHELVAHLDSVTGAVRERRNALAERLRTIYDSITLISITMGLAGAVVFGSLVLLFFSRLVWDIRKLQVRAMEVVRGSRGRPLTVTRRDELGELMESVNRMQAELRDRERELEIARRQSFHQEKMAAIGSLAAAIAHEVNNPIAAITGVAEAIEQERSATACRGERCRPELILEQTRRINQITRQLAEMTAPYAPEPQLLDLNTLVRSTCGFVRYDKRFRNIEFSLELDAQVPAITVVADHLTQVLMNLLINAADAMSELAGRKPLIAVRTGTRGREVMLTVEDNGCGMDAQTLARAFDEAFTTKPPGKGSGLGLFMCRSLVEAEGGRIELISTAGQGTLATIRLPGPQSRG